MKTTRIGAVREADTSLWPLARRVGSVIAYAGVPASTLTAFPGVLVTVNVLTSFYLVAIFGVVGALRGARVPPSLVALSYFVVAWYVVLLAIELIHGGPFHYPFTRGANFLTDYFPLVALPFFAIGLREVKAELRIFEYVMMGTIVFSAGLSLYQFFVLDIQRPNGFSRNPIPFALVLTMWSMFLFSGALKARKIDWTRFAIALIGLAPIILSGSKNIWFCAVAGYSLLFFMWAWTGRRWSIIGAVVIAMIPLSWLLAQTEVVRYRITEFMGDYGAFLTSGDTSGGSFGLRYGALVSGFLAFLDRPFLGYGLAQGKSAAIEHLPPTFSSIGMLTHLHNEYITHLVAFGILGLFFIVSFFAMFILVAARREDVAIRRFGVVAGTLFLFYMAADVVFTLPEVYGLVFFLLGLVLLSPEKQAQIEGASGLMRRLRDALPLLGSAGGRLCGAPVTHPVKEGRYASQPVGRWRLPALPLRVLLLSVLAGLIGFAWAQRGVFYRVAQTAILTEQDDAHPRSAENRIEASVDWRFVANGAAGPALVANFDIPATGAHIRLSMRKNTDAMLPASHIIEVVASSSHNFPGKVVTEIGKLVVKLAPEAEGVPLVGDVAKISDGVFWIGLSAVRSNTEVNLRLLDLSAFFDLPLTYESGQHATLTFEKGRTGVVAFEQALSAFRR